MTVYTTLPTDDLNLAVTVIDDPDLVVLNITPAAVNVTSAVTSVNGLVGTVTLDSDDIPEGTTNLYSDQPNSTTDDVTFNIVTATNEFIGDLDGAVRFAGRNVSGATIAKGQVIYISGISGNTPEVSLAKADSSTTMPAFGIAIADISNNATGQFATFGSQTGLNVLDFGETGITFQIGDTLYISHTEAGHITNVAPPNENCLIQNIGKIERATPTTNMTIKVGGAGRSNATPNLNDGNIFLGNASNQSVPASLDTSVSALGYITNSALTPYYTSTQVDALPVSTFSNDAGYSTTTGTVTPSSTDTFTNKSGNISQWTNDEAYIKADSTDTLTNKSGNISQWTNDEGYLTSETDSQTLSFSTPDLTISNGNTVDLTTLKTTSLPFSSITSTPTTIAGYGITDAFDGDYNSLTNQPTIPTNNNQLTNGAAYITASSTDTLTNKSGSNSQWTNDEAYLQASALTPYYTSTQVDALPVSTFSNDAGYLDNTSTIDGGTY